MKFPRTKDTNKCQVIEKKYYQFDAQGNIVERGAFPTGCYGYANTLDESKPFYEKLENILKENK